MEDPFADFSHKLLIARFLISVTAVSENLKYFTLGI